MSSRLRGNRGFRCGSPGMRWATLDSRRRGQHRGGRPTALEQAIFPVLPGPSPVRTTASGGTRMASIRTARVLAAVAALPLTAALFSGVAAADNGSIADTGSNAGVATMRRQRGRTRQQRQLIGHPTTGGRLRSLESERYRPSERLRVHGPQPGQLERPGQLRLALTGGGRSVSVGRGLLRGRALGALRVGTGGWGVHDVCATVFRCRRADVFRGRRGSTPARTNRGSSGPGPVTLTGPGI